MSVAAGFSLCPLAGHIPLALGSSQRVRHAGLLGHLSAGSPRVVEHILWQTSRKSGKGVLVLLNASESLYINLCGFLAMPSG